MPAKKKQIEPREDLRKCSLMEFIPQVSPKFDRPEHIADMVDVCERITRGEIKDGRYVITVPMRHGKTQTLLHWIPWSLMLRPELEIMYISYGATFAQKNSRKARRYAMEASVQLSDDHNTISEWLTTDGGGMLATGIDGEIAGRGADIVIIDDPIKSREKAESYDERQKAADFVEEAISRLHPGGSFIMNSARWHVDDPSGQLLKKGDYTHIHKQAIIDEGLPTERALCPSLRPLESLKRTRHEVGPYNWASWYQGEPRPPDSNLFRPIPTTYRTAPESTQQAIGIDLGFTRRGDASSAVVMGRDAPNEYILQVEKCRKRIPDVARMLMALKQSYPTAPMFAYVSGPEVGTFDLLREEPYNLDIICLPARYNKYVRAMATADKWNAGAIQVPALASWNLPEFVEEVKNFTGEEGGADNAVDAMVAAHDALDAGSVSDFEPGFHGSRCM